MGWLKFETGANRAAARHFEIALKIDPDSPQAREGLSIMAPGISELSERTSAIIRSGQLLMEQDWENVAELDDLLASWHPGDLLFDEAIRMRIAWRIRSQEPIRGREAVEMAGVLLARRHQTKDLLLLIRAATLAGQTERAWAALGEFVTRQRKTGLSPALKRQILNIARNLPDSPYADAVRPLLGQRGS